MSTDPAPSRLTQQQQARAQATSAQQQQAGHEFATVEDLLRADRAQTPPPPQLEARVRQSLARETPPRRPWWSRWWRR